MTKPPWDQLPKVSGFGTGPVVPVLLCLTAAQGSTLEPQASGLDDAVTDQDQPQQQPDSAQDSDSTKMHLQGGWVAEYGADTLSAATLSAHDPGSLGNPASRLLLVTNTFSSWHCNLPDRTTNITTAFHRY
ncbi:hypothetical protein Micbo1qcDRAFT_171410 [Microdochium bolleyi]|uniref:Uncharacterized protein n=1 Tax=Microdochium bolleyi TaxID=196109 RepID=A0A136JCV7_9PEZI|nr:hypothetical protein Micbo1qcDRAFT_171410 [Microdochium bolleyi]